MNHSQSNLPQMLGRALVLALLSTLTTTGLANPQNPTVVHGQASFAAAGGALNVTNTPGAIINWQSFSIQQGELTRFNQQGPGSAVLNRVTGQLPSEIFGQLLSNGRVFLINPNGLLIGGGAQIDTAGFLGSTLDISNEDFLAGRMNFSGNGGRIENQGYIRAGNNGEVILIAPSVENSGIIETESGEILLAAGREVRLTSLDDANISFKVQAPGDSVINLGQLIADNGAVRVFADSVFASGKISADRVSQAADGSIVLEAGSSARVSGELLARGRGVPGGDIQVLGGSVSLEGARLDASGQGGGKILVGGDYQGGGGVRTADTTRIDAASSLAADAIGSGDGGRVIVWSDGRTNSQGTITARGGEQGGDGGFVETSGKQTLEFGPPVDVSAVNGEPGTWLLDPEDITIGSAQADSISASLNGGSNVSIQTSDSGDGEGNITVAAAISKTEGPDASLSMKAHNDIDVNAPITSTEGKLDVKLSAGNRIAVNAAVRTNGGKFSSRINPALLPVETDAEERLTEVETSSEEPPAPAETPRVADADINAELPDSGVEPEISLPPDSGLELQPIAQPSNQVTETPTTTLARQQLQVNSDIVTGGGRIDLDSGAAGDLLVNAALDASAVDSRGGAITVEGQRIGLLENASVDASGLGGGDIAIGGGLQGRDADIRNAGFVHIDASAVVRSDALQTGDGGQVTVFAEDSAMIAGELSARGGAEAGNGGFIETSGLRGLRVERAPDVSAQAGEGGTWLIDPVYNVNVVDIGDISEGGSDYDPTSDVLWQPFEGDALIHVLTVRDGLDGGNVVITTASPDDISGTDQAGNINWDADLDLDGVLGGEPGPGDFVGSLTLLAHNDVNIRGSITDSSWYSTDERLANLTIVADQDGDGAGSVTILGTEVDDPFAYAVEIDAIERIAIKGNGLTIEGGATEAARAVIVSANRIDIDAGAGDIDVLAGADGNSARVESNEFNVGAMAFDDTTDTLDATIDTTQAGGANMTVRGSDDDSGDYTGAWAGIRADTLAVNLSGNLSVEGGDGAYSDAYIGPRGWYEEVDTTQHVYDVGGNVNVIGGQGDSSPALLGVYISEGDILVDTLNLDAAGDLNLTGGAGYRARAEAAATMNQDLEAGNDIILTGGAGEYAYAQVKVYRTGDKDYSEAGPEPAFSQITRQRVVAGRDLSLSANASGARIGLDTFADTDQYVYDEVPYTLTGNLTLDAMQTVSAGRNMSLQGGMLVSAAPPESLVLAAEPLGNDPSARATIDLNALIVGESNEADGEVHTLIASQSVSAANNLDLLGGTGLDSEAGINLFADIGTPPYSGGEEEIDQSDQFVLDLDQSVTTGSGNIGIDAGSAEASSGIFLEQANNLGVEPEQLSFSALQSVMAGNDLSLTGSHDSGAGATIESRSTRGTTDSDLGIPASTQTLSAGNTLSLTGGNSAWASATILNGHSAGTIPETTIAAVNLNLAGGGDVDDPVGGGFAGIFADRFTATLSGDLALDGGTADYSEAFIGPWNGYSEAIESIDHSYTVGGSVDVSGGEGYQSWALLGSTFDGEVSFTRVDSLHLDVEDDVSLSGGEGYAAHAEAAATRDLDIEAGNDISLTGGPGSYAYAQLLVDQYDDKDYSEAGPEPAFSQTANQRVIAGRDLSLNANTSGARIGLDSYADTYEYFFNGETTELVPGELTVNAIQTVGAGRNMLLQGGMLVSAAPPESLVLAAEPLGGDPSARATIDLNAVINGESNEADGELHTIIASQSVSAGNNLDLAGGTGVDSEAGINLFADIGTPPYSEGEEDIDEGDQFVLELDQSVTTTDGNISIDAGSANASSGIILAQLNSIGAAPSQLSSNSFQDVSAGSTLSLTGGDSLAGGGHATIENQNTAGTDSNMTIAATNISLTGGSNGSQARILHTDDATPATQLDLDASGNLQLNGLDAANRALISTQGTGNTLDILGDLVLADSSAVTNNDGSLIAYNVGTLNVGGTMSLQGGTVTGAGDIAALALNWESGAVSGSGNLTTTGTGGEASTIAGDGPKTMSGRSWEQQGDTNWNGGDFGLVSTTLNNSGNFTVNSDNSITEDGVSAVNNSGTLVKVAGDGTTQILPAFVNSGNLNANAGTLLFSGGFTQDAGQTDLGGGNLASPVGFEFNAGSLTGEGELAGDVDLDEVTVAPGSSPGVLSIVGNLVASGSSVFEFELAGLAPGEFDQILVSGTGALDGTLDISFIDGYNPVLAPPEDSFDLIETQGGLSGGFADLLVDPFDPDIDFTVTETPAPAYTVSFYREELPPEEPPAEPPVVAPTVAEQAPEGETPPARTASLPVVVVAPSPPPVPDVSDLLVTLFQQVPPEWPEDKLPRRSVVNMCMVGDTSY